MFKPTPKTPIPTVFIKPFFRVITPLLSTDLIFGRKFAVKIFDFFFYCSSTRRSFLNRIFFLQCSNLTIKSILDTAEFVFEQNKEIFQFSKHAFYSQMILYLIGLWILGKIYHFRVISVEREWAEYDLVPEPNARIQPPSSGGRLE